MLSFIQEHRAGANNSWALRDPISLLWAPRDPVSLFWALRDPVSLPWAPRDPLDCLGLSEISMRSPEPHWALMSMKDGPAALGAQCGPEIPE